MKLQPHHLNALVLMSDFGSKERFVASMKGVAHGIAPTLSIFDLTHEISPFNIWEAAQTLAQTIPYWGENTVFVSVVDPGVGTSRASVVAQTNSGHIIVTPENGTLTQVAQDVGIQTIHAIDTNKHRRPKSAQFHTFHGRDVYVYVGALLASNALTLQEVGPVYTKKLVQLNIPEAEILPDVGLQGTITKIEYPYGNVVSNIPFQWLDALELSLASQTMVQVKIQQDGHTIFKEAMPLAKSFGFVNDRQPLVYGDSQGFLGLAINQGNFAQVYDIGFGEKWTMQIHKFVG